MNDVVELRKEKKTNQPELTEDKQAGWLSEQVKPEFLHQGMILENVGRWHSLKLRAVWKK